MNNTYIYRIKSKEGYSIAYVVAHNKIEAFDILSSYSKTLLLEDYDTQRLGTTMGGDIQFQSPQLLNMIDLL